MNVSTNRTEILYRINEGGFWFSIISLISSFIILLIIAFNKILRSLTYNFLICVFMSEFFGSLGNICEYQKEEDSELLCRKASYFLIPLSDSLTMSLFCFFSYCSIELIIKSNKNIKQKEKIFLVISFIIAICYSSIIGIILYLMTDEKNVRFYFYEDAKGNFIRFIHIGIIICATFYMSYNTYAVIQFLKEKQTIDRINSWKIAKLSKILFRFPLICLLYWIFYLPSLSLDFYKGSNPTFMIYDELYKNRIAVHKRKNILDFLNIFENSIINKRIYQFRYNKTEEEVIIVYLKPNKHFQINWYNDSSYGFTFERVYEFLINEMNKDHILKVIHTILKILDIE